MDICHLFRTCRVRKETDIGYWISSPEKLAFRFILKLEDGPNLQKELNHTW